MLQRRFLKIDSCSDDSEIGIISQVQRISGTRLKVDCQGGHVISVQFRSSPPVAEVALISKMAPIAEGFWGEPTSLIDWCENNYEVNYYIAEFWNTVSNVGIILPPLVGAVFASKDGMEARIICCHLALVCVGVGSWLFHMSLQWWSQLLDEMPMIWGTIALVYSLWELQGPPSKRNYRLLVFLVFYCSVVTWIYLSHQVYDHFTAAYGALVFAIIVIGLKNMREISSLKIGVVAFMMYASGLVVWTIDQEMCSQITQVRENLLYPFRPFTQLHAWWHFFAGIGTYISILSCTDARMKFLKKPHHIQWTFCGLPLLRCKSEKSG